MANKIGVNAWTWVSPFTTENAGDLIRKTRTMGFDVFEIPLEIPERVDAKRVRALLEENDLDVAVCGAFGPNRDLSSDDSAIVRQGLEYIETALKFCQAVGSKLFVGPIYSDVG